MEISRNSSNFTKFGEISFLKTRELLNIGKISTSDVCLHRFHKIHQPYIVHLHRLESANPEPSSGFLLPPSRGRAPCTVEAEVTLGWKVRLPSDRTIRIFEPLRLEFAQILSEFRKFSQNSSEILKFGEISTCSRKFGEIPKKKSSKSVIFDENCRN